MPGILTPIGYAALATVLVALAAIVTKGYARVPQSRSLAQLVSETDADITGRHQVRHQS